MDKTIHGFLVFINSNQRTIPNRNIIRCFEWFDNDLFFTNMIFYWLKTFDCTSTENESIMSLNPMILTSSRVIRFWNNLNDIHCIYFAGFVTGKDIENVYILTITQYSCISIHSILLFLIEESFLMTSVEVWLSIDDIIIVSSRETNLYRR